MPRSSFARYLVSSLRVVGAGDLNVPEGSDQDPKLLCGTFTGFLPVSWSTRTESPTAQREKVDRQ